MLVFYIMMSKVLEFFLNFLFPKSCLNCGRKGQLLCPDCYSLIPLENGFLLNPSLAKKPLKFLKLKNLDKIYWATNYQVSLVQKIIHSYKYHPFVKELSEVLGQMLFDFIQLNELNLEIIDYIVPVPSHLKRLKWRGFDHVLKFSLSFAEKINISVITNNLIKTKPTLPQVNFSKTERGNNISGSFNCRNPLVFKDKNILVIDDVFTTGATLEEAAKILKLSGAQQVYGLVIAKD